MIPWKNHIGWNYAAGGVEESGDVPLPSVYPCSDAVPKRTKGFGEQSARDRSRISRRAQEPLGRTTPPARGT